VPDWRGLCRSVYTDLIPSQVFNPKEFMMNPFQFTAMTANYAQCIVRWKYDGVYAFYDYDKEANHILDTKQWGNTLFAVLDKSNDLVGELTLGFLDASDEWVPMPDMDNCHLEGCILWIGFGLRPDLTGRGHGLSFVNACVEFATSFSRKRYHYTGQYIGLGVYQFNQRAIKVYERIGFAKYYEGCSLINGKEYKTQRMKKNIDNMNCDSEIA
jgi:ribosomal-protein-alanine N-acetyltransferase